MLYLNTNQKATVMTKHDTPDELALLYSALVPALSKAAIGDFSGEVEVDPANSRRVNEILMGVGVLLEVIRDKNRELEEAKTKPAHRQAEAVELLDEMLGRG
jgi:hypothetical protein